MITMNEPADRCVAVSFIPHLLHDQHTDIIAFHSPPFRQPRSHSLLGSLEYCPKPFSDGYPFRPFQDLYILKDIHESGDPSPHPVRVAVDAVSRLVP